MGGDSTNDIDVGATEEGGVIDDGEWLEILGNEVFFDSLIDH